MYASQTTIAMIIGIVILAAIIRLLFRPKRPPHKSFKCTRCSIVSAHNDRTIQAWRGGAKKLFCDSCHRIWLSSQPNLHKQSRPSQGRFPGAPAKSGCLGVTLALVICPLAILVCITYA